MSNEKVLAKAVEDLKTVANCLKGHTLSPKDLELLIYNMEKIIGYSFVPAFRGYILKEKKERIKLDNKIEDYEKALQQINDEELRSQRPGGGYSKSAIISYNVLQKHKKP